MDRSMKVMFGMMTVAICLMALSMTGNQSQQAYAGEYVGGDRGTEPTIVSFRVVKGGGGYGAHWGYRMWSDGSVEVNFLGEADYNDTGCYNQVEGTNCSGDNQSFSGWILITDSVAGYACAGDTDGNRSVDVTDMLAVFNNWGECEEDPPVGLPDDDDLM